MRTYAYLDHAGPIAFAHRGAAAGGPGNTLIQFQRAVDLGFRYLETDVNATADGALLAFHDRWVPATTGDPTVRLLTAQRRVARLTLRAVRTSRLDGQEEIPLLADLLEEFPETRLNIDVKNLRAVTPLVELIRRTGAYDRVCIASFSQLRLTMVRAALGPRVATAFGPVGVAALKAATRVELLAHLVRGDVPCVQIPVQSHGIQLVTQQLLELAHRLGLKVHVWTIDDPGQMAALLDMGVDGIMTDQPELLRDVLAARGCWPTPG